MLNININININVRVYIYIYIYRNVKEIVACWWYMLVCSMQNCHCMLVCFLRLLATVCGNIRKVVREPRWHGQCWVHYTVYIYIHIYTYVYIHICIYIYIYTVHMAPALEWTCLEKLFPLSGALRHLLGRCPHHLDEKIQYTNSLLSWKQMNQENWEVFDQWEFSDHWKLFEQRHNASIGAMSDNIYIYIYCNLVYIVLCIYIYIIYYIYIYIQIQELCGPGFCRVQADMMIYIYICGHLWTHSQLHLYYIRIYTLYIIIYIYIHLCIYVYIMYIHIFDLGFKILFYINKVLRT